MESTVINKAEESKEQKNNDKDGLPNPDRKND